MSDKIYVDIRSIDSIEAVEKSVNEAFYLSFVIIYTKIGKLLYG